MLESGNVVAQGLAVSLDKPLEWAVGGVASGDRLRHPRRRTELPFDARM